MRDYITAPIPYGTRTLPEKREAWSGASTKRGHGEVLSPGTDFTSAWQPILPHGSPEEKAGRSAMSHVGNLIMKPTYSTIPQ